MLDAQTKDSKTVMAAVLAVLALGMIVWGWVRAHSQIELNPVSAPPQGKGGGAAPSTE